MKQISDNLLAAFLEGNVTKAEAEQILREAAVNPQLRELVELSGAIDNDLQNATSPEILPMRAKAAASSGANRCAMLCELDILRRFGVERSEEEWTRQAFRQGWLDEEGTALYNIGRMLEQECFSTARIFHANIEMIRRALERGCDVIAVVDSNEMTRNIKALDHEKLIDEYVGNNPNHAVIIRAYDPQTRMLTIFDPANGTYSFPVSLFKDAWDDSSNYLVVVNPRDYRFYEPHPIDLSEIELPEDLEELREAIAENAHEVWAAGRKREGWTYGPERNDQLKQTPDMVPYSDLSESEKQYDRDMAMNTLRLLTRLGYKITKK